MMRILIITALYPPAVGGAATYFGDIRPVLAAHPEIASLTILTECMPGQPRRQAEGNWQVLRDLPTRVSVTQRSWLIHAATFVLTQLWFAAYLPRLVKKLDVDLVHFHTRYRGRLFRTALQRCHVPLVADLRDQMSDPAELAQAADRLLCCSEGVRRFAIQGGFPQDRISLVPIPFIPPEKPSPERVASIRRRYQLDRVPYLLFVGDMTYNKGVYDLLEAYRLWQHPDPVRLVFAGANRESTRFLDRVQQTQGAIYLGRVPHEDVLVLIHSAEIVILPSRSEGLPRVILEAVALGTKVLCPPAIPEFDEHLPWFVLPQISPEAIVEGLNAVRSSTRVPSYPLGEHSVNHVVGGLVRAYHHTLERRFRQIER
jgi:glycosyltransferase involved in cell wall biosynthesis